MVARAFLGNQDVGFSLKFNPEMVEWGFQDNLHSQDTLGGRVVQLLSVQATTMSVTASAGSRSELQMVASKTKQIMKWHIDRQVPVRFKVPSRRWDFNVYVQDLPRVGWDVYATNYPYQLNLALDADNHIKDEDILGNQLNELAKGIGYDPAVHGGDPAAFQQIVNDLLSARSTLSSGGGGGGGSGTGTVGNVKGCHGNSKLVDCGSLCSGPTTCPIIVVMNAVKKRFPDVHGVGTYVCKITNSGGFSQHCAGNAWDIVPPPGASTRGYLNHIYNFLKANLHQLPISQVIWLNKCSLGPSCSGGYVPDHMTHIHVSGLPYLNKCEPGCNP